MLETFNRMQINKHVHTANNTRLKEANRITWAGLIVNVLLTVFKFFAGIAGRSGAMLADAVHSFSDLLTDVITFVGVAMGAKPDNKKYNYGHGKFETMASLIISVFLIAVAVGICREGISKIIFVAKGGMLEAPGSIALIAAVASVLCKEIIFRLTMRVAKRINSPTLKANAWHHRSDAFSSIGVLCGLAGAILLGENFRILDPVAAVVVSFFIGRIGVKLGWDAVRELLERSLPEEIEKQITQIIDGTDGLCHTHNLRTRRIGATIAIDAHVLVEPEMTVRNAHAKVEAAEVMLHQAFGEDCYISIHIEPMGE